MKKKYALVSIIMIISMLFIGCDRDNQNSELFDKGREALENNKYSEAKEFLSDYLNEEPKDDAARSMYKQAFQIEKAIDYRDRGLYDKSLECLDLIVNIDSGSKSAKVEANNLKNEVEKLKEDAEVEELARKEEAKKVAGEASKKAEDDFYAWQQNEQKKNEEQELEQLDEAKKEELEALKNEFLDKIKDKMDQIINQ